MKTFLELSKEQKEKPVLTERASSVVYHVTQPEAMASIAKTNSFMLTSYLGTSAEIQATKLIGDIPKTKSGIPKYFYMSVSRTPLINYGENYPIRFVLDGDKINQNMEAGAFNYWAVIKAFSGAGRKFGDRFEAEDRIFSDKNTIKNANKYIRAIHIFLSHDSPNTITKKEFDGLVAAAEYAKKFNIPLHLFQPWKKDEYRRGDTRVSIEGKDAFEMIGRLIPTTGNRFTYPPDKPSILDFLIRAALTNDEMVLYKTDNEIYHFKEMQRNYYPSIAANRMANQYQGTLDRYRKPENEINYDKVAWITRMLALNKMSLTDYMMFLFNKFPDKFRTDYEEKNGADARLELDRGESWPSKNERLAAIKKFKVPKEPVPMMENTSTMKSFKEFLSEGSALDIVPNADDSDGFITKNELRAIETLVDALFKQVGMDISFTKHFYDRVNDARNGKPITTVELMSLFRKSYAKYGKELAKLSPDIEGVLKDVNSSINVPFVLNWDNRNQELDLVAKTVMRKRDFMSDTKFYTVTGR